VNGLLIIDKPAGWTSHDAVAKLRRMAGERQIGHLGTLDPMATGVLPMLLGKWTRLAQYFGGMEKAYTGTIRFGYATDSYDAEGKPVGPQVDVNLNLQAVREAAAGFVGTIDQMPPIFSAKKIEGKAAYALARAGKVVELKAVPVTVHRFVITQVQDACAQFEATLSAGGYVRSLAHELGRSMGCGAHLTALRRVAAGPFTIEQARTVEEVASMATAGTLAGSMPHARTLLPEIPSTTADEQTAGRIRNGNAANLPEFSNAELVKIFQGRDHLIGIGKRIAGTLFQPVVVLG
jgi:tRNA pseudouridine55 synthase